MSNSRIPAWLVALGLVACFAAPVTAQSPAPDQARPEAPNNPFVPPPCTGTVFNDVTCSTTFDPWIEQYATDAITGGCGGGNYCPASPVTRAQMAVFVEKAMRGTLEWSPGDLGGGNTGLGAGALLHNTQGRDNTAIGDRALMNQSFTNSGNPWITGNTAVGTGALYHNEPTTNANGVFNTAIGSGALGNNLTGFSDVGVGAGAVSANTTGFDNTAVGYRAGSREGDTVTGYAGSPVMFVSTEAGSYNTFVGIAGSTAEVDNCTAVGMDAYCDATNQVRLGNFFVSSIGGKVAWSALSDARAKSDIRDLELGLPFVLALRPVSYRYKSGNGRVDMGFVGQDMEALLGDGYNVLDVGGDAERTLSLRYSELIAPLVKAVQEQEADIESRDARIAQLEDQARAQQSRLDALEEQVRALKGDRAVASACGR